MDYTISFFTNGYGQQPNSISNVNTIPELPILVEDGFTFGGWYLDEYLTLKAEEGTTITSDIILYAAWTRDRSYSSGISTYTTVGDDMYFEKDDTSGGGRSVTTSDFAYYGAKDSTTTAYYYNSDGIPAPHYWVPDTDPNGGSVANNRISYLFTLLTFSNFKDSSGNAIKGFQNFAADTWRPTISANIFDGSTQLNCIKRGCMPLFNSSNYATNGKFVKVATSCTSTGYLTPNYYITHISGHTGGAGGWKSVTLTRTDTSLTIGDISYSTSDFKDGAIPELIFVLVQGGGGGGGGTTASVNASGGSAGGWAGSIINIKDYPTLTLQVGSGGAGGYKDEYDYGGDEPGVGCFGDGSYVDGMPAGKTSVSDKVRLLYGTGGYAGQNGTTTDKPGYGGGSGPKICHSYGNGGRGSGGDASGSGGSADSGNLRTTDGSTTLRSSATHHIYVTLGTYAGGTNGNGKSGGGGGSILGSGGNGGVGGVGTSQAENYGKAGGLGAGGGGARYYFGRYNRGGNGGSGAIFIWW